VFEKILIANRGEIARRIIRTAERLGVATVAIYSEADAAMQFVREAGEAHCIGPPAARESYLKSERIIQAALASNAQAIHPGYGFLSENAEFAEAVEAAGLTWIGAPPSAIRAMGLKHAAKRLMVAAGVRVTPGYMGEDQSPSRLKAEADRIGYPVLIKAVAGGGGKGMRRVDTARDFADALVSCQREAASSFGDDRVLIEKYILGPRHIEVQVFGDRYGNVVHLFERDCSLQRRHQKVIEEAPAPGMDVETRAAVCEAAVKAARAVDYVGAGTIEFIADASEGLRADRIWFMEMNTRLQVEHPVTESITGQDLVEWQLRVAGGEPLPVKQADLHITGWAMEARLYAENPTTGFLPSTGPLHHLRLPSGIRVDSGVEQGSEITSFYDPMIAKLIVHAPTRRQAAAKLAEACSRIEIWPVHTNAGFLSRAAADPNFIAGEVDTGFIERHSSRLIPGTEPRAEVVGSAAVALLPAMSTDPWTALRGFRINAPPDEQVVVAVGGRLYQTTPTAAAASVAVIGNSRVLFLDGEAWTFGPPVAEQSGDSGTEDGALLAPMPGRILLIDTTEGSSVSKGQKLIVMEAMKMELVLSAPFEGVVETLKVKVGDQVTEGTVLAMIASAPQVPNDP
jgi:3-methylcrotonyl-CoA carboxylase alpha subunit